MSETSTPQNQTADEQTPEHQRPPSRWWLTLDAVIIFVFVIVGRDTHEESQSALDVIETAAPFLWGLLAGWAVTRAWKDPISLGTGIGVAVGTVVGGMLLRRLVYDDGIATPFIVVAALFLVTAMLGWRGLAHLVRRRRSSLGGPAGEERAVSQDEAGEPSA